MMGYDFDDRYSRRNDMKLWYIEESGGAMMDSSMYDSETDDYYGPGPGELKQ